MMQHQYYWLTKKSLQRKLGSKEDDCIVASDAELDAKLGLFKSINDSCVQLQRIIDLYQECVCYLAQEENALGHYLKEHGKSERNASAGQIMSVAGKTLAFTGHQRLTIRPPLVRLHHEVETFRDRAVADTKMTVNEMEKVRTEYRAALSWMKSVSSQLDPDTEYGLDRFRKTQSYVKSTKTKFDKLTLTCLQKVDLLAAARCNMFSISLPSYQKAISTFATKAMEALLLTVSKLDELQNSDISPVSELVSTLDDKDKNTFFNAEYTDKESEKKGEPEKKIKEEKIEGPKVWNLLGEDFLVSSSEAENPSSNDSNPSFSLFDLSWVENADFLENNFMPSNLMQQEMFDLNKLDFSKLEKNTKDNNDMKKMEMKHNEKKDSQMSWLSLFADLDPLANFEPVLNSSNDRA